MRCLRKEGWIKNPLFNEPRASEFDIGPFPSGLTRITPVSVLFRDGRKVNSIAGGLMWTRQSNSSLTASDIQYYKVRK